MAGEATATGAAAGTMISPGLGTVIGAGLGLAGDLLGMSSSKSEGHKNRSLARHQFREQMDETVQRRVQDALKAGINPLTALGYNGGASPTIHAGGDSGTGQYYSNMGSRMQRMMEKLTEEKVQDDVEYDRQVKKLDLEGKRLENRILQQRLDSNLNNPGRSEEPPVTFSGDTSDLLFVPVYDLYGNPRLTINQNVMESDSDNAGYRASILAAYKDAVRKGHVDFKTGRITDEGLLANIDHAYYTRTGKHIENLPAAYLSNGEAGWILFDAVRDGFGAITGKKFGGD